MTRERETRGWKRMGREDPHKKRHTVWCLYEGNIFTWKYKPVSVSSYQLYNHSSKGLIEMYRMVILYCTEVVQRLEERMRKWHLTRVALLSFLGVPDNHAVPLNSNHVISRTLIREGSFQTILGNQNKRQGYKIRYKTLRN